MLRRLCRIRLIRPKTVFMREVGNPTGVSDHRRRVGKVSAASNPPQMPGPHGRVLPKQVYAQHLASDQPHPLIRTPVHAHPALLNQVLSLPINHIAFIWILRNATRPVCVCNPM
jgi:hypothetical protein